MSNDYDDIHETNTLFYLKEEWKFLKLGKKSFDDDFISFNYNDNYWTTIQLPHIGEQNKSSIYLYRKLFHSKFHSNIQQSVHLNFLLNDEQPIPGIKIWINEKLLFAGTLSITPIEITKYIKNNANNLICIISTEGYPLSVAPDLFFPGVSVGRLKYNTFHSATSKRQHKTLDYMASINGSDGLIDLSIQAQEDYNDEKPQKNQNFELHKTHQDQTQTNQQPTTLGNRIVPRLAILILIVGTRGDVQPFIALAKELLKSGHRVRLATHETFRKFVRENGIEFYPLAANPADLMSFMVKNSGILPSVSSIVAGDIGKNRQIMSEILLSTWHACVENDDETDVSFRAEIIIANPPSFGHIHCAEKLQIPLHMMFTMPWSPTGAFPHPFCKIKSDHFQTESINRLSYDAIETLTWSGMRDIINEFRESTLKLKPLHTREIINAMTNERVPYTYCWSPSLVSKPDDWEEYIHISGFFFLDLATNYKPPDDLIKFLEAAEKPIYIGFGSITGHDSRKILDIVLEALQSTRYRALLSGLAADGDKLPDNVFRIDNCPHDWLFQYVSAVCHHGGAGTTAAGLRAGKPTIVVPFFGDQFFWGTMIHKSGAGPAPIPGKGLNVDDLAEAFKFVHKRETKEAAENLRIRILSENGCASAVDFFHRNLPLKNMTSDLEPSFGASYFLNDYNLKLSMPVAQVLIAADLIQQSQLSWHTTYAWENLHDNNHPCLPVHGLVKHSKKALRTLFVDTPKSIKRASDSDKMLTRVLDGAGCMAKGVGKGIGHASIGCLSFYGDVTDALERIPNLYDPYSDTDRRLQPKIDGVRSGVRAAGHSVWHGFKDGTQGLISRPCTGFQQDGMTGGAIGAAVSIPNAIIKPVSGALGSLTWLSRGISAEIKQLSKKKRSKSNDNLSILNAGQHSRSASGSMFDGEREPPSVRASLESGFHVHICKQIIDEFQRIKHRHDNYVPDSTIKHLMFFRQRSRSSTDN